MQLPASFCLLRPACSPELVASTLECLGLQPSTVVSLEPLEAVQEAQQVLGWGQSIGPSDGA